ncbi:MAG: aminotransferase class III-fold pyridoxal phosphate-dependent enzyme [Alistipes indistinctus]
MSTLKTNPVLGHITTFGGHPVCCAAGLAALEYLLGEGLMQQADAKGARYEQAMRAHPAVKEVRRAGLLMAVEFGDAALCERVVQRAVETGLLTEWFLFWPTALRIAPPLTITDDEIDASCRILLDAIDHAVCTGRWQVKHIPFSPTPERGFSGHPAPANTAPYPSSGPRRPPYLPDHTPAILPARKPGKRPGRRGKPTRGDRKIVRPSRTAGSGIRPPLTEPGQHCVSLF